MANNVFTETKYAPQTGEQMREHKREIAVRETDLSEIMPQGAFSRIAETPLVPRNGVKLLVDAAENYPAWLAAIENAEKTIHFESYIIHEDEQGNLFADALIKKAREGVKVRLIYDWMGGFGKTSRRYWNRLRENGVEVRCFNPFSFLRPLGWINRDHRKVLIVDGQIGFVTGLCVGCMWVGDAERGIEPWRDTGIELRGKAVAHVDRSFAEIWEMLGDPIPRNEIASERNLADAGEIDVRVVSTKPGTARLYRLDQMVGAMAQETLWLTDAYFAGTNAYIQTLRSAALDGVDVRLLVPAATDIPVMQAISRSGYRTLLEAGVKVYEWNGTMLHAKTAVVDGFWSRVGSTNLNMASWLTNCEIDVLIEDANFGSEMQQMYLRDLQNATEIVLDARHKARPISKQLKKRRRIAATSGATARYAPSAIVIGGALGASFTAKNRRELGAMEAKITLFGAILLLLLGIVAIFWSRVIAIPIGIIGLWLSVSLFINAYRLFRQEGKDKEDENLKSGFGANAIENSKDIPKNKDKAFEIR